jgi:hypothetical protein
MQLWGLSCADAMTIGGWDVGVLWRCGGGGGGFMRRTEARGAVWPKRHCLPEATDE